MANFESVSWLSLLDNVVYVFVFCFVVIDLIIKHLHDFCSEASTFHFSGRRQGKEM
jgi:hypothetical protein